MRTSVPVIRAASARKAHLRASLSTRSTRCGARMARTRPGKPAPLPRSTMRPGCSRQQRNELRRVEHVAPPGIGQGAGTDEVDALLPARQQRQVGRQAVSLVTAETDEAREIVRR